MNPAILRGWVSINADGTGNFIIGYYSNAGCTTTMIYLLTPVTYTYVSDTTMPANGKLFDITAAGSQTIATSNAAGGTHLTSVCPNAFGANSGVGTDGGYDCTDNRFDFASAGTVGELVLVLTNSTTLSTTSMLMNMPADASAATSTTLTFTK